MISKLPTDKPTRQLVIIRYINNKCVVLKNMDGSIYKIITEKEPVRIGNQCRKFIPEFDTNDKLMHLRKYDRRGFILEDVFLPRGRKVLWAITSGAARRGLIHMYKGVDLNESLES